MAACAVAGRHDEGNNAFNLQKGYFMTNEKTNPKKMPYPVCNVCGSADVVLEAVGVFWDKECGRAEISDLADKGHYCNKCDGETRLEWKEQ